MSFGSEPSSDSEFAMRPFSGTVTEKPKRLDSPIADDYMTGDSAIRSSYKSTHNTSFDQIWQANDEKIWTLVTQSTADVAALSRIVESSDSALKKFSSYRNLMLHLAELHSAFPNNNLKIVNCSVHKTNDKIENRASQSQNVTSTSPVSLSNIRDISHNSGKRALSVAPAPPSKRPTTFPDSEPIVNNATSPAVSSQSAPTVPAPKTKGAAKAKAKKGPAVHVAETSTTTTTAVEETPQVTTLVSEQMEKSAPLAPNTSITLSNEELNIESPQKLGKKSLRKARAAAQAAASAISDFSTIVVDAPAEKSAATVSGKKIEDSTVETAAQALPPSQKNPKKTKKNASLSQVESTSIASSSIAVTIEETANTSPNIPKRGRKSPFVPATNEVDTPKSPAHHQIQESISAAAVDSPSPTITAPKAKAKAKKAKPIQTTIETEAKQDPKGDVDMISGASTAASNNAALESNTDNENILDGKRKKRGVRGGAKKAAIVAANVI